MRSYINIFLVLLMSYAVTSCKKNPLDLAAISSFGIRADSMNITNDSASYMLGSKTTFNFSGSPSTVIFYSGAIGRNYLYRNRLSAAGISTFIFTNALNAGAQANSLHVMLSSDFKGVASSFSVVNGVTTSTLVYDSATTLANIAAATWNDITPAKLATNATAVTDTIDLSAYAAAGKKVYIAFKYTAQAGSIQNKWTITNVNLTNNLPDNSTYTIANLNDPKTPITNYGANTYSPGWVGYMKANYNWAFTTGSSLVITGASTAAAATTDQESWALLGAMDLTKVTPDIGVPITNIASKPSSYTYVYGGKGTYNATFMANNFTAYSISDTVSRTIPVVIH